MQLAKVYSHIDIEAKWYRHWVDEKLFAPSAGAGKSYSIVIPPPNYKPKRPTKVMPQFPFLKEEIPYLAAYLTK